MKPLPIAGIAIVAFILGLGAMALYDLRQANPPTTAPPTTETASDQRRVLYWYDPMVPQQRFDQPGKSPYMDMQLQPKYADEVEVGGAIQIDPRLTQNLGVSTAVATLGRLPVQLRVGGAIAFDERTVALVQAPVAAIVERLHVRAPLIAVKRGEPLLTLLAPEWTAAQAEYLALRRAQAPGMDALRAAARQRLLLLGMNEAQIRAIERRASTDPRVTVSAPRDGVVGELNVREGASVMPGAPLLRINGLDTVWVEAAIAERDAGLVVAGARVVASVPAYPGRSFDGTIEALLPSVDAATRTLAARIVLDNTQRALSPGMFAAIEIWPAELGPQRVLIPSAAVIATGVRDVVIVVTGDGGFRAQEIRIGREAHGQTEILEGLAAGDEVVSSGQFLIDSEASLSGALSRFDAAPPSDKPVDATKDGARQ